jgi:hypothetical protein
MRAIVWNNMKLDMVSFMDGVRQKRLSNLHRATLSRRSKMLDSLLRQRALELPAEARFALPNVADLYVGVTAFKDIIDTPLTDEEEDTVAEDTFVDAMEQLSGYAEEWRLECYRTLLKLLPPTAINPDVDDEFAPLRLATSLFTCTSCSRFEQQNSQPYSADNLLAHTCSSVFWSFDDRLEDLPPITQKFVTMHTAPWNLRDRFKYNEKASNMVRHLAVEAGSKAPETLTFADMDDMDWRFACSCVECIIRSPTVGGYPGLTWRHAVRERVSPAWNVAVRC